MAETAKRKDDASQTATWCYESVRPWLIAIILLGLFTIGTLAFIRSYVSYHQRVEAAAESRSFTFNSLGRIGAADEPDLVGRNLADMAAPSMKYKVLECCRKDLALRVSLNVGHETVTASLWPGGRGEYSR